MKTSLRALLFFFALTYLGRRLPVLRTGAFDGARGLGLGVAIGALGWAGLRGRRSTASRRHAGHQESALPEQRCGA